MATEDQLALLKQADSPTVANVIELFGIRAQVAGYTNHTIKAIYPELPPSVTPSQQHYGRDIPPIQRNCTVCPNPSKRQCPCLRRV